MVDDTFLNELASNSPTPGGGGASAYAGALASALASMVANLTVGKKKYDDVSDEMSEELLELETTRSTLLELIDEDAQAFGPLSLAYKMPSSTEEERAEKEKAMQQALIPATEVPLEIMRQCMMVIESCDFMAKNGNRSAISDAGTGVILAKAALRSASLNILINARSIKEKDKASGYLDEANMLLDAAAKITDEVYEYVLYILKK
ncbi:MAG: cyclodeaminase/cyclohydrolase family protein [Eggerthellaceae bacterium]|nr:cyclodeaminase/cyclohydrolase family protein [Eggerthellaceae bacterium]